MIGKESPSTNDALCQVWFELYGGLAKFAIVSLSFDQFESPSNKDTFKCQVQLSLTQMFWRKHYMKSVKKERKTERKTWEI